MPLDKFMDSKNAQHHTVLASVMKH